jgi:hypothetical protein
LVWQWSGWSEGSNIPKVGPSRKLWFWLDIGIADLQRLSIVILFLTCWISVFWYTIWLVIGSDVGSRRAEQAHLIP